VRDRDSDAVWQIGGSRPGEHREGRTQQQARHKAAQEIISQVGARPLAKDRLQSNREQTLQRHENDAAQHQPDAQPDDGQNEAWKLLLDHPKRFHDEPGVSSYTDDGQHIIRRRVRFQQPGRIRCRPPI
jgi:hypothetical protein